MATSRLNTDIRPSVSEPAGRRACSPAEIVLTVSDDDLSTLQLQAAQTRLAGAAPLPIGLCSGSGPSCSFLPLLTLSEVAELLRLNERTIRRMVSARRLPCVRLGRQLRFAPRALSRWLQAREEG